MQLISIQFTMLAGLHRSGEGVTCAYISTDWKRAGIGFDALFGDDSKGNNDSEREPEIYQRPSYIWT